MGLFVVENAVVRELPKSQGVATFPAVLQQMSEIEIQPMRWKFPTLLFRHSALSITVPYRYKHQLRLRKGYT